MVITLLRTVIIVLNIYFNLIWFYAEFEFLIFFLVFLYGYMISLK